MSGQISYKNEVFRKLIHLSSLWMVVAIYILPHYWAVALFATVFLGMVLFEVARSQSKIGHDLTQKFLGYILRQYELKGGAESLTGAFYVCLAVFVGVVLFPKPVVITAVAIMLICDTVAALVGRKIGTHKILDKSLEGSLAFFCGALVILSLSGYWGLALSPIAIIATAFFTMLIELISSKIKIDDNLTIVFLSALLIYLFNAT